MKAAIIGLPQSGKSTLFRALCGRRTAREHGVYAIATIPILDPRVDRLKEMFRRPRAVYATLEIVEVQAQNLGKGDRQTGLDASSLGFVRPMDAFVLVIRAFDLENEKEAAVAVENVLSDIILTDLITVENRLERIATEKRKGKQVSADEVKALESAKAILEAGKRIFENKDLREAKELAPYALLSAKPTIVVANIAEKDLGLNQEDVLRRFGLPVHDLPTLACCAQVEQELSELLPQEQAEFRQALGVKEPVLDVLIRVLYSEMGLISFLTVGEEEVRAWPVRAGTLAPKAAGVVHTDMERGFIRAEVISYEDLVACGSEANARKAGKYRLEGREYQVQDGDVIHFRFAL